MKVTLHLEHLRHFHKTGVIFFSDLVHVQACDNLKYKINKFLNYYDKQNKDVFWNEGLFRSIPDIADLIVKYQLGKFAAELIGKSPIYLISDIWLSSGKDIPDIENDCMIFLYLEGDACGSAIFFENHIAANEEKARLADAQGIVFSFSSYGVKDISPVFYK